MLLLLVGVLVILSALLIRFEYSWIGWLLALLGVVVFLFEVCRYKSSSLAKRAKDDKNL